MEIAPSVVMMIKSFLFALQLSLAGPASAAERLPTFDVRCDLGGAHAAGADRLESGEESRLAQEALRDAYPLLPEELQDLSRRIVFVLAHKESKWTKLTFGWGPEDDAEYRYPDTRLFPAGTIKVSLSEKTLEALALGRALAGEHGKAGLGASVFSRYIIAHELIHASQYARDPVPHALALHRGGDQAPVCRAGLLGESLLAQAEKRLDYERQAYGGHRRLIDKGALTAFAAAVEARQRSHPEEFAPGARYGLLAADSPSPFVGKIREEAEMTGSAEFGAFGPLSRLPNEGQVIPARIVWTLKRLNDRILREAEPLTAAAARAEVDGLKSQWGFFMTGDNRERVAKFLPCDASDLEARYDAELSRYELFLAAGRSAGGR